MKVSPNTEERVARILEKMRNAMPEIKRQIKVYEENVKSGTVGKLHKIKVHSQNV